MMNITHTYNIKNIVKKLSQDNLTNVVYEITYQLTSIDLDNPGVYDTVSTKTITFDTSTIDTNEFIPYENLNKEIVVSWISDITPKWEESHVNAINEVKNPTISNFIEEVPSWG